MAEIQIFNPPTLGAPMGQYSQIARVKSGELVFIAGQLSATADGTMVGADDFDAQCIQVFANIATALASCDATWQNVVQFTTYLVDARDISKFMAFRLREFPGFFPSGIYPPNTLLIVDRLVGEPFKVEVQTTAAL